MEANTEHQQQNKLPKEEILKALKRGDQTIVARKAGVSKATVSCFLNDTLPVNDEIEIKILNAIDSLLEERNKRISYWNSRFPKKEVAHAS